MLTNVTTVINPNLTNELIFGWTKNVLNIDPVDDTFDRAKQPHLMKCSAHVASGELDLLCLHRMRTVIVAFLAANFALAQASLRGVFNGDWTGTSASGDIRISVTGDVKPVVEVIFTIANNEVKTRVTSADVTPKSIEATYEFDLGDNKLQSAIKGHLDGSRLEGTYKTIKVPAGTQVDEGTWKAMKE